jgi:hypothetical protein
LAAVSFVYLSGNPGQFGYNYPASSGGGTGCTASDTFQGQPGGG